MKNKLGLKGYPLELLDVGQAVLIGPYLEGKTVSSMIAKERASHPDTMGKREFTQHQMLLVDPLSCETFKMFLVKRTK